MGGSDVTTISDSPHTAACAGPILPAPRYLWCTRTLGRGDSELELDQPGSRADVSRAAKTMLVLTDCRASSQLPLALTTNDRHIALTARFNGTPTRALADAAAALRVEAMIVDARDDIDRAQIMCHQLAATTIGAAFAGTVAIWSGRPAILAMIEEDGLSHFNADWGADDFIVSTASAAELDMRVRRAIGRAALHADPQLHALPETLVVGPLVIDPAGYTAVLAGRTLSLPRREFELLAHLARSPGQVLSRETLLNEVWQYGRGGATRTVDVHIRSLRVKLGQSHRHMIRTVRNTGYQLLDD